MGHKQKYHLEGLEMNEYQEQQDKLYSSMLSWFDANWSDHRRQREIYQQDYYDMLAIDTDVAKNKQNPLDHLNDPGDARRGWKDKTNFFGIKAKAKATAIKAQILEAYKQGKKIPASLEGTPVEDLEEQVIEQYKSQGAVAPPEVLAQAKEQARAGLQKSERYLFDQLVEADFDGIAMEEIITLFVDFGAVGVESPNEETERRLKHNMTPTLDAAGRPTGFVTNPEFVDKTVLRTKVRPPWECLLDVEANGDSQKGRGLCTIDYLGSHEVRALKGKKGYDQEAIKTVIEELGDERDASQWDDGARETKQERYMGLMGHTSKPHEMLTIYYDISRSELLKADREDLVKEMDKDDYYKGEDPVMHVMGIFINRQKVYCKPLHTVDKKRPLNYTGMVPLRGTNYFFGIYSLGRPGGVPLNKLLRRAIDNEILTGSGIIGMDTDVVDPKTAKFEPGAIWSFDFAAAAAKGYSRAEDAVFQVTFQSVAQGLMGIANVMDALIDEITMAPKNLAGISGGIEQTATEVATNLSSAQTIILGWLKRMDKKLMVPTIQSFYDHMLVHDMLPQDAAISAKIRVFGADTFANQAINKRMLIEYFNIVPSLLDRYPELKNRFKTENQILGLLESLGFEKEDVVQDEATFNALNVKDQQLQEMQQQVQQMQEQMQQMEGQVAQTAQQLEQQQLKNKELSLENGSIKESARTEGQRIKSDLLRTVETEKAKRNKELGMAV
jgi:hypothetical protein